MKLVEIKQNNEMNELDIDISTGCIEELLTKESTSQGLNCISELYSWSTNGSKIICYGWYDGEAGFENKHDLPPSGLSNFLEEDSSEKLLFGDIFLLKIDENKIMDFVISDYGEFYNMIFGGMDNCDTETDEEDINTEEEDEDYTLNDNNITEDDYEILSCNEEDNLELDDNNY